MQYQASQTSESFKELPLAHSWDDKLEVYISDSLCWICDFPKDNTLFVYHLKTATGLLKNQVTERPQRNFRTSVRSPLQWGVSVSNWGSGLRIRGLPLVRACLDPQMGPRLSDLRAGSTPLSSLPSLDYVGVGVPCSCKNLSEHQKGFWRSQEETR